MTAAENEAIIVVSMRHLYLIGLLLLGITGCAGLAMQPAVTPTIQSEPTPTTQPSLRGSGSTLQLISWDAPTTLNPHLSTGNKDFEASRIIYEPLASFDKHDNLFPILAEEIPSLENGDLATDGRSVTWRLKRGVQWSDGEDFSADDVLFTYDFITNPLVESSSAFAYETVSRVEAIDRYTVKVHFADPNPAWFTPFVGIPGQILPEHKFSDYNGVNAKDAPANFGENDGDTVGTGPYRVVSFKPQETLFLVTKLVETNKIVYEVNPFFREPDKPYFSRVELLGGREPHQAALAVFTNTTPERADYAFDLQESPDELQDLIEAGHGTPNVNFGSRLVFLDLNRADPTQDSRLGTENPFLSDLRVRQALAYAIDRETLVEAIYGQFGHAADQLVVAPEEFHSSTTNYTFDQDQARELLEAAGWIDTDGDGIRDKDGMPLRVAYESSVNFRELQQLIRRDLRAVGIEVEIKTVDVGVFLGEDQTHPDSSSRFLAEMQTYDISMDTIDPGAYLGWWKCDQIPQAENNWGAGINVSRWCDPEFDELHARVITEIDEVARRELIIEMNDRFIEDVVVIPLVHVADISGMRNNLTGVELTPWDADVWQIKDWRSRS